jgi:Ca2+-binding RTX toxin-like protein
LDGILARLLMSGPLGSAVADSAVYVPEIDRLLTVQTPADLLNSFKSKAPSGDGIAIAGYWAAVLPLAREIIQDVGGDSGSASFTAAVAAALDNNGLAPFADLLSNGIIALGSMPSVLQNTGVFRLTSANDTIWLGAERHAMFAGDGADFVAVEPTWAQSQLLDGGSGNDQLFGSSSSDWIDGGAGADTLSGGGGNDTYTVDDAGDVVIELPGGGVDGIRSSIDYALGLFLENLTLLGSGNVNATGNWTANTIAGNAGNNIINGGLGQDTLTGNAGADRFSFQGLEDSGKTMNTSDVITDFLAAQGDRIDISAIDAISSSPSNDAFVFVGASAFSAAGQVRSFTAGGITYVALNIDSNLNTTEMMISLSGALALKQSDFML